LTVLITGATGLIGSRLLPRLVDAGIDCRALVRPGSSVPGGIATAEGDLLDPRSLASAVEGASGIVHLAAVLRRSDPDEIRKANVDGTQNLLAAAKAHA
jgi:UDP-glucose 4-epimerase